MLLINKVIYKLFVYNFVSFLLFSKKIIQVKLYVAKQIWTASKLKNNVHKIEIRHF